MSEIRGLYVANVTPLRGHGAVDANAYVAHAEWLKQHGVDGFVLFGTTGEGPLIADREKLSVLERFFEHHLGPRTIVTLAQPALPEALTFVRAVNDLPAQALLVLPPYYFKPVADDGLRRYYHAIVDASRHPVIVYHIPKYAVAVPVEVVAALRVWGVKDSGDDPAYAEAIHAAHKGVLLGTEEGLWPRLAAGATGMISDLGNIVPDLVVAIDRLAHEKREVEGRELGELLEQIRAKVNEHGLAALKAIAHTRSKIAMGSVRPPLLSVPADYDPGAVLELAADYRPPSRAF
jgi:4-hydroxy-tetrahydrodipicolinate synthase